MLNSRFLEIGYRRSPCHVLGDGSGEEQGWEEYARSTKFKEISSSVLS